jgi:hypothetical protein
MKKVIGFMKEKKTKPPTYREKRRENSAKKFLSGEARHPYVLREDIVCGLSIQTTQLDEENEPQDAFLKDTESKCICQETLGQVSDMFRSMILTGQKLVKRASNQKYQDTNKISGFLRMSLIYMEIIFIAFLVLRIFWEFPVKGFTVCVKYCYHRLMHPKFKIDAIRFQ